ncbi:glycosyl transferase group protein [Candidatus Termititenax persephonae]|uniref:Glycosyl transferase group protein n=1 Tax=Candidatus Termititenax persephonae TaxID=2218525 RepID=A0A388TEY5_9BACT|nr:glycosyl transferase group protein [Candidatus Termititenax persephonae]
MAKPLVSIVVPTYNRLACLKQTLASLEKQTFQDFEVVVSDDGSADQTRTLQRQKFPFQFKLVSQLNSGRAAARNHGIAESSGEIVIFIDDHIILDKDFVREHYFAHKKYEKKGVAVIRGRAEYVQTPDKAPEKPPRFTKKISKFNENSPFVNFITNNISITRYALELTGGFDPEFKEYGFQDQELGYRIRQRGFKFKVNPKAVGYIFNVDGQSTPELLERKLDKFRQAGRSAVLFSRKHYWGGLGAGVNLFNVFLNAVFSLQDDWFLRFCRRRQSKTKNEKSWQSWRAKIRWLFFLKGLREGFDKYPADKYAPRSGANVVMLVSHQADLSGAPISLTILANRLRSRGYYPIFVLPHSGPIEKRLDKKSVKILNLHGWFKAVKLYVYMARFRPAIVHANTFLTEYALDIARRFGIKTIMHVREDLTMYPQIAVRLLRKANRLVLISNSMVRYFDSEPTRLDVVYNAVEELPNSAPVEETPYKLLYVGAIEKRKGLWDLVRALDSIYQQNKRVTLTVVGQVILTEKSYLWRIKRFLQKRGLSQRVKFVGSTPDVGRYLDEASLVVVPSHQEPFGRVVIEAMARRKIVVATMVGGIPEIIEQYRDGFLVEPGNPEQLAKMIMYVWNKSPEHKEQIKDKAYRTVAERFLPDGYVDNIVACYKKLL